MYRIIDWLEGTIFFEKKSRVTYLTVDTVVIFIYWNFVSFREYNLWLISSGSKNVKSGARIILSVTVTESRKQKKGKGIFTSSFVVLFATSALGIVSRWISCPMRLYATCRSYIEVPMLKRRQLGIVWDSSWNSFSTLMFKDLSVVYKVS